VRIARPLRGFSWINAVRVLLDARPLLPAIGFTLTDYGFRVMKRCPQDTVRRPRRHRAADLA